MKTIRKSFKALFIAALALTGTVIPQHAFAGSYLVNSTGVNDETLFIVLALIAVFQVVAILVIAGVIKSIVSNKRIWEGKNGGIAGVLTLMMVFIGSQSHAQSADFDALVTLDDTAFVALLLLNVFLFTAFIYLVSKLNSLFRMISKEKEVPESFMDKINSMLTDSVPLAQEEDVMMDHEYDGIRELDNNLPPWWLYGFYVSIFFAFIYIIHFHIVEIPGLKNLVLLGQVESGSQKERYFTEMEEAEAAKAAFVETQETSVDENNVLMLTDEAALASGQKNYNLYCMPCHGESGGSMPGGVGPNLTDDYWIHGGSMNDIYKTIKYGVPEKGMVSWQAQLNPSQIQELASYIKSLRGTNPPNAKEPQGELWQEEETADEPTTEEAPTTDSTVTEPETEPSGDELTAVEK